MIEHKPPIGAILLQKGFAVGVHQVAAAKGRVGAVIDQDRVAGGMNDDQLRLRIAERAENAAQ